MVAMPIFSWLSRSRKQPFGSSSVMNWKSCFVRFQFFWLVRLTANVKSCGVIVFILNMLLDGGFVLGDKVY